MQAAVTRGLSCALCDDRARSGGWSFVRQTRTYVQSTEEKPQYDDERAQIGSEQPAGTVSTASTAHSVAFPASPPAGGCGSTKVGAGHMFKYYAVL